MTTLLIILAALFEVWFSFCVLGFFAVWIFSRSFRRAARIHWSLLLGPFFYRGWRHQQ